MAITCEHLNQIIISVEELKNHYSFQLKRVGFPQAKAVDMATLMVQPVTQLTHLEQSRMGYAISVLEEQKAIASPKRSSSIRVRRRFSRSRTLAAAAYLSS